MVRWETRERLLFLDIVTPKIHYKGDLHKLVLIVLSKLTSSLSRRCSCLLGGAGVPIVPPYKIVYTLYCPSHWVSAIRSAQEQPSFPLWSGKNTVLKTATMAVVNPRLIFPTRAADMGWEAGGS